MYKTKPMLITIVPLIVSTLLVVLLLGTVAHTQESLKYYADPTWPKTLPNNWKIGGITGLAVDSNNNIWVLNRPNDLADLELLAEVSPPTAQCCVRPPSMIHIDQVGNVIGSFDAQQGHGMDVDDN